MQYLLTAEFRWLIQNGFKRIDGNNIHEHDAGGFILKVDLDYLVILSNYTI